MKWASNSAGEQEGAMVAANGVSLRAIHRESVNWSIGLSVVLIVVGLLALLAPLFAGVAVEAVIAWLLILGGLGHLVLAWHVRGAGSHVWEVLIGLAYVLAGGYLFFHPLAGLVGLTVILGAYLLFKGIFELVAWFSIRDVRGSMFVLLDGVVSLLLAAVIWRQLPTSAGWVVGTLLGFAILFTGISRLALALSARRHWIGVA
jgi:uncharacterized membrane protein HdeD (DUF308 family)